MNKPTPSRASILRAVQSVCANDTTTFAPQSSASIDPTQTHQPRDPASPNVTKCDATRHQPRKKTPIQTHRHPSAPLSPRQLAAARLFTAGHTVYDVALQLNVSRNTLWRWRNQLNFQLELQRLHNALARPDAPSTPPRNSKLIPVKTTNSVTRAKDLIASLGFGHLLHEKRR